MSTSRERLYPSLIDRLTDDSHRVALARQRVTDLEARVAAADAQGRSSLEHQLAHERMQLALVESEDRWVVSERRLREQVLRDVGWLLGATTLESQNEELRHFPLARHSVVNFGLPGWAGQSMRRIGKAEVEERVRSVIRLFEPRLIANTVEVELDSSDASTRDNLLAVRIRALLWARPVPVQLTLRSSVDLDTGAVQVEEVKD